MKIIARLFIPAVCAVFFSPPASAQVREECAQPETPSIPDGRRSRETVMQDTYQSVQDYLAQSQAYRECLQVLLAAREEDEKDSKAAAIINEMINESLEVEQLVADTFNRELRAYKADKK